MIITLATAGLTSTLLVLDAIRQPAPDSEALELVRQARELTVQSGDAVWPGFAEAPDRVLLIDGETEFLLCHEGPAAGFSDPVAEPVTCCTLRHRDRQFPPALLASFPPVDGVPTIVVGTPEATGLAPQDWMRTLLHEHFHQWETAPADAYQRAMDLDLHDGDQTGMWMLSYPLPYEEGDHGQRVDQMAALAIQALEYRDTPGFRAAVDAYVVARRDFLVALPAADARYYEFQVRKEGVARWTELAVPRQIGSPDLATMIEDQDTRLFAALRAVGLAEQGRVAFYALGAAEAEMLDQLSPHWRQAYLHGPLELGHHFEVSLAESHAEESD